jgi:hypothetical protein
MINYWITEKVTRFKNLGRNVSYKYDDTREKLQNFQIMCGTISRMLKNKTRNNTKLKLCKIIATPALLYGCESWVTTQDKNKTQTVEMKLLPNVKGCTRLGKHPTDTRRELTTKFLNTNINGSSMYNDRIMTDCLKRQQRTERVKKPGTSAEKMG